MGHSMNTPEPLTTVWSVENSDKPQNPTVPLVLSLVACFLFGIVIIVAGYFHGNMHLLTTLKNAKDSYS